MFVVWRRLKVCLHIPFAHAFLVLYHIFRILILIESTIVILGKRNAETACVNGMWQLGFKCEICKNRRKKVKGVGISNFRPASDIFGTSAAPWKSPFQQNYFCFVFQQKISFRLSHSHSLSLSLILFSLSLLSFSQFLSLSIPFFSLSLFLL